MTEADFYFNAEDRLQIACRLAARTCAERLRTVVCAPDAESAQRFDRLLWSWPATAFVPHCRADDPLAAETPVLIAIEGDPLPEGDVLLNLAPDCPSGWERYRRVLEVVSREEADRARARARYARYRAAGCTLRAHDLAQEQGRR